MTSTPTFSTSPTIHDIVQMCLRFDPKRAAETNDSTLCVTPLITQVTLDDGSVVSLSLVDDKWAAHYARVSDIKQRSQSENTGEDGVSKHRGEGNSEAEQIERGIRHYISRGQAFKIYSDASISGDHPNNDPALIRRMYEKKAQRYKRNFLSILLDPVSIQQYTTEELASCKAFMERRVAKIRRGGSEEVEEDNDAPGAERRRRGRPSQRAHYRRGFSQLWDDGRAGHLHTVSTSDESRLCRDADLFILFLEMLQSQEIELLGLTHAVADLDVSEPMNRAITHLLGAVHESRLRDISSNTWRGKVQGLRQGKPQGILPWYTRKADNGRAILIPEYVEIAQHIIHLSLSGMGTPNICKTLQAEGHQVKGKWLTKNQIETLLTTDAILGLQHHFGLTWHTLPVIVDQTTYDTLQAGRKGRRKQMDAQSAVHDEKRWAIHLLTHIAYCGCGRKLRRRYVYEYRAGKRTGVRHDYYDCPVVQRQEPHICIRASVLEGFFEEIVRDNPRVLTGAFRIAGKSTYEYLQAQQDLLEARLQAAEAELAQEEEAQRAEACERADKTGVASASPHYADMVDTILKSLLETPRRELDGMRQEMQCLREQMAQDRRQACLARQLQQTSDSLQQLQQWDDLDTLSRNRLLKTIFARVVVHTMERGGRMELHLVGLDTPLPPVPLRRGPLRTLLPSAGEWLATTFAE